MQRKTITSGFDAQGKIKKGVDTLANAVKVTLGPRGRTVVIEKKFGSPHITKDGVTVAKEIELAHPVENVGAQLVKEVASKTADDAGDGTTTATVLTQAIFAEGLKNVVAGANPMDLKRGIDKAAQETVSEVKKQSIAIESNEQIAQIATISANNDKRIGAMIAEAMQKVGNDGVITVEEAKSMDTTVEVTEGMQFDQGIISPYLVNDRNKMVAELKSPLILITDKSINSLKSLLPVLEKAVQKGKPFLIIAENLEGEALASIVVNKLKGVLDVAAVKAPGFGDRRKAMLEDIAVLTGGTVISEERGYKLENATLDRLGTCEKVNIDKDSTVIVNGGGKKSAIEARIKEIKNQIAQTTSDYDREKLQERLAKLAGGVATLYIGAATEVEMKEKKDRVQDALSATRAAVEEGIVPGGGIALLRARSVLKNLPTENEDQATGVNIVRSALAAPIKALLKNVVGEEGPWYRLFLEIEQSKEYNFGYNAHTGDFGDLREQGVIDPTKVVRGALENAASAAGLMLTTTCVITDTPEPEEKKTGPAAPPMPGGMGGMM